MLRQIILYRGIGVVALASELALHVLLDPYETVLAYQRRPRHRRSQGPLHHREIRGHVVALLPRLTVVGNQVEQGVVLEEQHFLLYFLVLIFLAVDNVDGVTPPEGLSDRRLGLWGVRRFEAISPREFALVENPLHILVRTDV